MDRNFYNKVIAHHKIVEEKVTPRGYIVLMTVAIGSQNYGLANDTSDCDTFSFVLPSFLDFIRGDKFKSYEFEVEDGKCSVKDLRLALNLLRKPSPNSVECFLSSYKVYNPKYEEILKEYLENDEKAFYLIHSNYKQMIDATIGTIHGLHGRNMSNGKKVAHVIRLTSTCFDYLVLDSNNIHNYLRVSDELLIPAINYKKDPNVIEETYEKIKQNSCNNITDLYERFQKQCGEEKIKFIEQKGALTINNFQLELTKAYLKEVNT